MQVVDCRAARSIGSWVSPNAGNAEGEKRERLRDRGTRSTDAQAMAAGNMGRWRCCLVVIELFGRSDDLTLSLIPVAFREASFRGSERTAQEILNTKPATPQ